MAGALIVEGQVQTPEELKALVEEEIGQHGTGWCGGRCGNFSRVMYHRERIGKGRTADEVKKDYWSCHTLQPPPEHLTR